MNPNGDLTSLLAPGIALDDVPSLWSLLRARPLIDTFITLFRGSDDEVIARLFVLREIGARTDATRWSPEALRSHFTYIDPVKLETVLKRLRENGLLAIGEDGQYQLSDAGRNAVASLAALLRFGENDDAELGFLTTQLAGMQATGTLTPEMLQHLLAKLNALTESFEDAIASGSEFRILDARSRLTSNMRWLEKGTEFLNGLLAETEISPETGRVAHAIGLAQSRLARVDAAFQRALNKIESQRVTLGSSGVSSSDAMAWLRSLSPLQISALAHGTLGAGPQAKFLAGGHELLDRAESVLSEEIRRMEADPTLPPAEDAPQDIGMESEDLTLLHKLSEKVSGIASNAPVMRLVAGGGFAPASYRFSLLALLGAEQAQADGAVAEFTQMPYELVLEESLTTLNEDEISHISTGHVARRES
ncbi:MAG TPA: hypothetical protein VFW00_02370 [Rhodocyclaceae bacterium]|nr:hypothetical protein [Rhodocyclaceae bacterium]